MNIIVLTALLSCLNSGVRAVTSRVLFASPACEGTRHSHDEAQREQCRPRAILIGSSLGYGAVITAVIRLRWCSRFLLNTLRRDHADRRSHRGASRRSTIAALTPGGDPAVDRADVADFRTRSWLVIAAVVAVLAAMAFHSPSWPASYMPACSVRSGSGLLT